MSFCSNCGKELMEGAAFCPECGSRVNQRNTAANTTGAANTTRVVSSAQPVKEQAGYIDMVKHVLLLIFTLGIWNLIWIYKTTEFLNCVQDEPPRNPTYKLLLCMFVPFYIIYWTYKHAQYIDRLAAKKRVSSDITMVCTLLEIFLPIAPPILMQDKLNHIVKPSKVR